MERSSGEFVFCFDIGFEIINYNFFVLDEAVLLPLIQDAEGHFADLILIKWFDISHVTQGAIDP